MATSTRSSGYKKKPTTNPASKGTSGPSNKERAQHAGKAPTQETVENKEVKKASKAAVSIPTGKTRQHQGRSKGKAKRKEKRELHEAHNVNVYQGSQKPEKGNKHQEDLAERGEAVRKILDIKKKKGRFTKTPYQSIKHTKVIRAARESEFVHAKKESKAIVKNKDVDPYNKKKAKAIESFAQGELDRLHGRKTLGLSKGATGQAAHGHQLNSPTKASRLFTQSKLNKRRSAILASELPNIAEVASSPQVRHGKRKFFIDDSQLKWDEARSNLPFEQGEHKGKKGFWLTSSQIRYLGKNQESSKQYKAENHSNWAIELAEALGPETEGISATVGLTKDILKPFVGAAAGTAVDAAGAGILGEGRYADLGEIVSSTTKAVDESVARVRGKVNDIVRKSPGVKQYRDLADKQIAKAAVKAEQMDKSASKWVDDVGLRKESYRAKNGRFASKWVPGKSLSELGNDLDAAGVKGADKAHIMDSASSKVSQQAEKFASDSSVVAGAGAPDDVLQQMLKEVADHYATSSRITAGEVLGRQMSADTKAKLYRAGFKYGPTLPAIGALDALDHDLMENAVRDGEDLVAGFVPSTVEFLRASGDAVAYGFTDGILGLEKPVGEPTRFESMWEAFKKTSPIALAVEGEWDKAATAFEERPISSAIELGGAYQIAGKAVGNFGRALPPGMRFGEIGKREDLQYWGNLKEQRSYSGNFFTKQVQKAADKGTWIFGNTKLPKYKTDADIPAYKGPLGKLQAKSNAAKIIIKINKDIDNQFAASRIRTRASAAGVVHEVNDVLQHVKKDKTLKRSDKRGSNHAIAYAATKIMRDADRAVEDLTSFRDELSKKITREEKKFGTTRPGRRKVHTENIDQMRHNIRLMDDLLERPELLKADSVWEAAGKYRDLESQRQDALESVGALHPTQRELAPYVPYMKRWMKDVGVKFKGTTKGKTDPHWEIKAGKTKDGKWSYRRLTKDDIDQHMTANGLDPVADAPAMISFKRNDMSNYGEWDRQFSQLSQNSTGDLISRGHYELDGSSLINQSLFSRRVIDERQAFLHLLDRMALRAPNTSFIITHGNKNKLLEFYNDQLHGHGVEAEAVNLKNLYKTGGDQFGPELTKLRKESLVGKDDAKDQWILVPKRAMDRLDDHVKWEKRIGKTFQKINAEFKGSVLAFSLKWHIGNIVDMASRLFFEGAGVSSFVAGRRLLNEVKKMDEDLTGDTSYPTYHDIMANIMGGHYSATMEAMKTAFDKYEPDYLLDAASAQRRVSNTIVRLGREGAEKLLIPYRGLQHGSFAIGSKIEQTLKTASFGKEAIKHANAMGYKFIPLAGLTPAALEDVAKGLYDSNTVEKFAKGVNDIMGDYTNMSPAFRAAVSTVMPFGLWARAATRFVLLLPAESPIRTAMITSVNRLNEKERAHLGLSRLNETVQKGVYPYQRGAIPATEFGGAIGNIIRTNTYTSFGVLNDVESYLNFLGPYEASIYNNLQGKNWFGDEMITKAGKPLTVSQKIGVSLSSLLQTFFAPLRMVREYEAKGTPSETWSVLDPTNEFSERTHKKESPFPGAKTVESPADTGNPLVEVFSPFSEEESGVVKARKYEKEQEREEKNPKSKATNKWLFTPSSKPKKEGSGSGTKGKNDWLFN